MRGLITTDNIKILISCFSLFFAMWQYLQKRRIKKLISFEAIELHKNIAVALGATDAAITAISRGQNGDVQIGRAQGLCQAVLYESAKLYCNLKDTKLDDIDDLISNNQLEQNYMNIYYSFSNPRRSQLGLFIKRLFN